MGYAPGIAEPSPPAAEPPASRSAEPVGERPDERPGAVCVLTVADVMAMTEPVEALSPGDRLAAAEAAMAAYGFAGLGLRRDSGWAGVALITPEAGLPRRHPLALGGIAPETAGLILLYVDPAHRHSGLGKRLVTGLTRRLRNQVGGLEAQAAPLPGTSTPLTPSADSLLKMGFQARRLPLNRYRLDFAGLATWLQDRLRRSYQTAVIFTGQTAPAGRVGR